MMIRLTFCAMCLMGATVALATEASVKPRVDTTSETGEGLELRQIEVNIVNYTNQERKRHGLPPLEIDKNLVKSARQHAIWMTRNRALQHTRQSVAENIAVGQRNSLEVVRAWMNSSGHRANILSGGHRRIGVAAYRTENGTIYWCQQFLR